MQIVIDIPEEKLNIIKNKIYCGIYDSDLYKIIANGTPLSKAHDNKDIATAFQFGMAFGFAKKYDELGIVMDYYLNCVLDKIRADIRKKMRFNEGIVSFDDISKILDKYEAGREDKE